jgi:hypothetical protein
MHRYPMAGLRSENGRGLAHRCIELLGHAHIDLRG